MAVTTTQTARREYVREERIVQRRDWSPVGDIFGGEFVVRAYSIIASDEVVLDVWEPTSGFDQHSSSFTSQEHGRLGALTSRSLPSEIAALPYGEERSAQCFAYFRSLEREARAIIAAAYPELDVDFVGGIGHTTISEFHSSARA